METKTKSTKSLNNPRINLNLWLEEHKEIKKISETRAENYSFNRIIKNKNQGLVVFVSLGVILGVIIGYLISKI